MTGSYSTTVEAQDIVITNSDLVQSDNSALALEVQASSLLEENCLKENSPITEASQEIAISEQGGENCELEVQVTSMCEENYLKENKPTTEAQEDFVTSISEQAQCDNSALEQQVTSLTEDNYLEEPTTEAQQDIENASEQIANNSTLEAITSAIDDHFSGDSKHALPEQPGSFRC